MIWPSHFDVSKRFTRGKDMFVGTTITTTHKREINQTTNRIVVLP